LILLTDGMETCHGDPNAEAARLAEMPNLTFGIHVIGFDVEPQERAAVEKIAKAGKGKFYDARSATKLQQTVAQLRQEIAKAPPLDENSPEIQALLESLMDRDGKVRREAAEGLRRAGVRAKAVVEALKKRVADDLWVPKKRFAGTDNACDPHAGGKEAALKALWELAPDQVTAALRMALKSRNDPVRAWAAGELANPDRGKTEGASSPSPDSPRKGKTSGNGSPAPAADKATPAPANGPAPDQPKKKRFVGFGKSQGFGKD
jgi:hypothetical protein